MMMHDVLVAGITTLLGAIVLATVLIITTRRRTIHKISKRNQTVLILVLGDLARSPRIQLHAAQLAADKRVSRVILAGHVASNESDSSVLLPTLRDSNKINILRIPSTERLPRTASPIEYAIRAALRVLRSATQVVTAAWSIRDPISLIVVQTPPAIPTLIAIQLVALIVHPTARIVIDWHNVSYTLMGPSAPKLAVKAAATIERLTGRYAFIHVTVSNAMANFLRDEMRLISTAPREVIQSTGVTNGEIVTLYDHAPPSFKRLDSSQRTKFLRIAKLHSWNSAVRQSIRPNITNNVDHNDNDNEDEDQTPFRIIVSATSWTEDEDFDILLKALRIYDEWTTSALINEDTNVADDNNNDNDVDVDDDDDARSAIERIVMTCKEADNNVLLPPNKRLYKLVVVITGKGPQREHYEAEIRAAPLRNVCIVTKWLPAEQYPQLLGSADAGVSLHTSSSGLDLPMKIVDMFGCELPVIAASYPCLEKEMLRPGIDGFTFSTAKQLGFLLANLFSVVTDGENNVNADRILPQIRCELRRKRTLGNWDTTWQQRLGFVLD